MFRYEVYLYHAEPFLGSRQLLSHARISKHFMKPEGQKSPLLVSFVNHMNAVDTPSYFSNIHFSSSHTSISS
jgi:hypothetical protein